MPPTLTEQHVRDWTAPRFVDRGRAYFREGRVRDLHRAGPTLKGRCRGSEPEPYRVEATLHDASGIASADCSCPMGAGGGCKHVVALLLAWIDAPDAFTEKEALKTRLQQRSKDELVALVSAMIERHPALERLLDLPLADGRDVPVEAESIRAQVHQALERAGNVDSYDYHALSHAEQDLRQIRELGDTFAGHGRLQDAVTVYQTLAETLRREYGSFFDPEGDLLWIAAACAGKLRALLDRAEVPAVRQAILKELFEIYAWDTRQGGYGIGDEACAALLEATTTQERRRVAGWGHEAFEEAAPGWARETLAAFILELEGDALADDAYLDLCRRAGLTARLIEKLLATGSPERALQTARHADDGILLRTADLFVERGHGDAFRALAGKRLVGEPDRRLVAWLRDYAATHGDAQATFDLSERLFWEHPSAEHYRALREAGEKLDDWPERHAVLIERLERDEQFSLLTHIHLEDGDHDAALRTVQQRGSGFYGTPGTGLTLRVAEAAAPTHPHRAADLYLERACALIEQRGRENYVEAARHLRCIRDIHRRLGTLGQAEDLIATLRTENARLPAFLDELGKAGL